MLQPHPLATCAVPSSTASTWADAVVDLDDDDLTELLDDALAEPRAGGDPHALVVSLLAHFLWSWAHPRRAGSVVASGGVRAPPGARRSIPDVQFFRADDARDPREESEPEVVVEVLSRRTVACDRVGRLHEYAARGIPEYWLVDPEHRTLERLVLWREQYVIADALSDDEVFRPPVFEGLEIPLEDLWALA